jgi:hypothetical protein
MFTKNYFAVMKGNPLYGERVKINNVSINDIISYKVKGNMIYSVVTGTTSTMIKVEDLLAENINDSLNFYINSEQNITTKCLLKDSRKIFKIKNISYL